MTLPRTPFAVAGEAMVRSAQRWAVLRTVFLSRIGEAQERVRPGGRLGSALEPPATGGSSVVDVIGKDTTGRRWSIGDLAHASGLTVRALYHYDEIGLLSASERTASGHRRYTEGDLRRLYRIRALRALGLSLEQIAGVLEDSSSDDLLSLRDLLADQLRNLQEQAEHIDRLRNRIHGLVRQLDESSMPDPDQFMTTLEMISVYETGFTREQREQLAERRAELGPAPWRRPRADGRSWSNSFSAMCGTTPPSTIRRCRTSSGAGTNWVPRSTPSASRANGPRPRLGACGRTTAPSSAGVCPGPQTG